ncbi:M14 family carboxypeptidase [Blattabacterium sp. (Blattella germanica) str. Bge]|uniref:M14 family zinc carboxypeptidase n=1 Tax=Blattabacterium sp. (Blattella germanica) TaxID=624186 RepID=UPI0001BB62C6|nr:M14 family zinc carboxypeptidase [Blattabacterium sp. (Blattella germanica)]ACY40070.1 M14 family carboxypeptidase [Blattabacterium sp. (Blattella germanica) str. Bge]
MSLFDIKSIFHSYESFKDKSINPSKIFRYCNLLEIIEKYKNTCSITPIGLSVEKRKIFKIEWGIGKIKVFIWSQMHGNETTGTKSMFDILYFFSKQKDHDLVQFFIKNLTILYIPMLNPDGSEIFQRRNAINIDLNRDAIRLQSPEIQVLFQEIHKHKPHILFNLHDQRSIYNVGNKYFNPAILSFLSPSVSVEKNIDLIQRKKSMGIIHFITKEIQKILPHVGSVGRFSDDFYPTATGDNLQKLGYPCILLEAGNYPKDSQKEKIRKYNTLSILAGFYFISSQKENLEKDYKFYFSIPENKNVLLDKIYRKVQIQKGDDKFIIDIGLMSFEEFDVDRKNLSFISKIVDIGDLSNFFAYEEFIVPGFLFHGKNGKRYPTIGDVESFQIF